MTLSWTGYLWQIRFPCGRGTGGHPGGHLVNRPIQDSLRLAVAAMATRFELVLPLGLPGPGAVELRAAGEAALAEILAAEDLLSAHRSTAQLAGVNARAHREPVRVSPLLLDLLVRCREGSDLTGGTFDPTVGALVHAWRTTPATDPDWSRRIEEARAVMGWQYVEMDLDASTLRFHRPGLRLDLGSVGKGWALDRAAAVLDESGVGSALIHGGTSTVLALGAPPGEAAWSIQMGTELSESDRGAGFSQPVIPLRDQALSVSATWGRRHLDPQGRSHGHVLDPRTGEPVRGPRRAIVVGPTAEETDRLSTALLVAGSGWIPDLQRLGRELSGWVEGDGAAAPAGKTA